MSWVEEGKGDKKGKDNIYSNTTKDIAKGIKEKSSTYLKIEDTGTLWGGYPWWGMPTRAGVVYQGDSSIILGIWEI